VTASLVDGWLCVPYDGPDAAPVHLAVTGRGEQPTQWFAAFLDYADGVRVAKVRPPASVPPRATVWVQTAGGGVTDHGRYPPA
jgi:hypothetical protein